MHPRNPEASLPLTFAELRSMQEIDTSFCKITDDDLRHLHGAKNLRKLRIYPSTTSGNKVTEEGLRDLQKALPDCTILIDGNIYKPPSGLITDLLSRLWPFK